MLTKATVVAGVLGGAIVGGSLGVWNLATGPDSWTVEGRPYSGKTEISLQEKDWTYVVSGDLPWFDARDTFHENGRAECLPVVDRVVGPVRLHVVESKVHGVTSRAVVAVECLA